MVKKFQLSFVGIRKGIDARHEFKDVFLPVPVMGNCRAYGNDLAQIQMINEMVESMINTGYCINNTRIKPRLVQLEARIFILMVFSKLAFLLSFHTLAAHLKKYTRTGSMQVARTKNSFISNDKKK